MASKEKNEPGAIASVDAPAASEEDIPEGKETIEDGEISDSGSNGRHAKDQPLSEGTPTTKDDLADESSNSNKQSTPVDMPPLPNEAPPLPAELPPAISEADDGWAPVWEETAQAFYFYNRFTGATQWTNPRVPDASIPPSESSPALPAEQPAAPIAGGYDPAIHGDYDENAWYAQPAAAPATEVATIDPAAAYTATAAFNRFTGRYQAADITPENYNDENKSKRQMNAFFDVDAAANNHDGRSLKEERSGKKLSKQELKQFKEKRKAKKEEKRRAWLRD